MSLLNYQEARPWAKAIKEAVATHKMPPWFADPQYGHFSNDRSLKPVEISALVKWADEGAPQGDPKDAPAPVVWPADGWRIKPDVIVKGVEFKVPKSGLIPWAYATVPSPFKEDTWVTSVELRPGANASLTHHYAIFIVPHKEGVKYGEFAFTGLGGQIPATGGAPFEAVYERGQEAFDYRPYRAGRLIPANSDIVFGMHWATNGTEGMDQAQVGFTVSKERPERQFVFTVVGAGARLDIPPNEANYTAPAQEGELSVDAEIVWMQMHAHYRAKNFTITVEHPDGTSEKVLRVNWDPYWQSIYYPSEPLVLPKGSRVYVEGHYDNSANNRYNPDPNARVRFGELASDEMLFPTFGFLVDSSIDLKKGPLVKPTDRTYPDYSVKETVAAH